MLAKFFILLLNVSILDGVNVNYNTLGLVHAVRQVTDERITITSAVRSPVKQAMFIIDKYNKGIDVVKYYHKDLKNILVYIQLNDVQTVADFLENNKHIAKHLCGRAVDIRTRDLDPRVIEKIMSKVDRRKYIIVNRVNPPHIHMSYKKRCK